MVAATFSASERCCMKWRRAPCPSPEIPPRLEELIAKALEKDRRMRYQHAAEMRTDLARLKRDTDSGRSSVAVMPTSGSGAVREAAFQQAPQSASVAVATPASGMSAAATPIGTGTSAAVAAASQPTSG